MTENTPAVTQDDINALLARLEALYTEIATARATIAPREEQLTHVANEYRKAVGRLQHEAAQLQAELMLLQRRPAAYDEPVITRPNSENRVQQIESTQATEAPSYVDPDSTEKDMLLQHMVRVLDHMSNEDDADLLARLQGLCTAPMTRLVDVLERIPWGTIWVTRGAQETLHSQQRRLITWERSLTQQLKSLQRAEERLRHDARYGLLEQYEQGLQHWQAFLQQSVQQQRTRNVELAAEVRRLKEERARTGEQ